MNPEELFNRAYDHHCAKRFVEALALYKQLVEQFPNCKRAPVARLQIKNLREFDKPPPNTTKSEQSYRDSAQEKEPDPSKRRPMVATFKCVRCNVLIRIPLPPSGDSFRCAQCRHSYSIENVSTDPLTILLVPEVIREVIQTPPREVRRYPQKVKDAFALLGIEPTEDVSTIKKVFRDMVSQYHPDKVAHLGKDLRHLAEERTKALVVALQTIEAYLKT